MGCSAGSSSAHEDGRFPHRYFFLIGVSKRCACLKLRRARTQRKSGWQSFASATGARNASQRVGKQFISGHLGTRTTQFLATRKSGVCTERDTRKRKTNHPIQPAHSPTTFYGESRHRSRKISEHLKKNYHATE